MSRGFGAVSVLVWVAAAAAASLASESRGSSVV